MNMIIRYYNQNRKKIYKFILVIASIIILIQLLNYIAKRQNEAKVQQNLYSNESYSNTSVEDNDIKKEENNNSINENNILSNAKNNIINQFINYCNNNQIQNAYEMISSDCKNKLFPTLEDFRKNYIEKIFYKNRTVKIEESMYSNVYKISYYTNALASGGYNKQDSLKDYIFFLDENGNTKISINKFLQTQEINKQIYRNSIYIKILAKDIYLEYENYQMQITNKSNSDILISNGSNIYAIDENEISYSSNSDELGNLVIKPLETQVINIKFNKIYNYNEKEIKTLKFTDIITNYKEYENGAEKQQIDINVEI